MTNAEAMQLFMFMFGFIVGVYVASYIRRPQPKITSLSNEEMIAQKMRAMSGVGIPKLTDLPPGLQKRDAIETTAEATQRIKNLMGGG